MQFEWDEQKNQSNYRKHGFSFEDVLSAFEDEHAILFDDPEHSDLEDRFILIGMSSTVSVCTVCHCYRQSDTVIRIISARKATKKEVERYVRGI